MTIENVRIGWLTLFRQMRTPTGFLQRLFTVKPGGQSNSQKVQIDIIREGESIAVPVTRGTGPNMNDATVSTTKEIKPPTYSEGAAADVEELLERMEGMDPYSAAGVSYGAQLVSKFVTTMRQLVNKIDRAIELQAAQILQTGKLVLLDKDGVTRYEIDYLPKATHFPTVGTDWGAAGDDKLGDLESLAEVIRADGKVDPNMLIFGSQALKLFLQDDAVQKALDNRRYSIGEIRPEMRDSGATFYGMVWVGAYSFEIWTYKEGYDAPDGSGWVKYIEADKVIMLSSNTRLDRASCRVPLPLGPDPRVAGLLPGRMQQSGLGIDLTPNVYCTPNGKQVMEEVETRTVLVPVQIDGFGCLDTEA